MHTNGERVAIYTNWFIMKQRPHHLVDVLNEMGHGVDVFCTHGLRKSRIASRSCNRINGALTLPARLGGSIIERYNGLRSAQMIKRFVEAASCLHVFASAPRLPLPKKPSYLIYDCMDDSSAFGNETAVRETERELCAMADRIWVVSNCLEQRLRAEFGAKVEVVPNAVRCDDFADAVRIRRAKPLGRQVLGYVGALQFWFDAQLVGKVAARLPDWEIVLVGPGKVKVLAGFET
jgi:hypothetical protein